MTLSPPLISERNPRPLGAYAALAATYADLFGGGLATAVRRGRELPEHVGLGDVALYGVATHRVSRLLSREKVARFARSPREARGEFRSDRERYSPHAPG